MGTLHLVATPIGNLEDITLRALRVLREAQLLFAEDTRRTRVLLDRHGVGVRPRSLHAHNEAERIAMAIEVLDAGGGVVLVSDAGMPLVSDPGERLVAAAIDAGHTVTVAPGASAVSSALVVSGLPATPFTFVGFLPRKTGERNALLEGLKMRPDTLVFFESPQRLVATLGRLREVFGDRRGCVARELTKLHEEVRRGVLSELEAYFETGTKGEITIVLEGASDDPEALRPADLDAEIRDALRKGVSSRELAADLATATGLSKRQLYTRIVELRNRKG
ncbi:MAG: 16S rRNA (cytidine(1402)-2'-O)-methyltransferase [Myxococcales bacterium]|nr:16S rRNA (cytidine(1402)-2'-O)-methyltransferase [Myxococcales bacterium]